MKFLLSMAVLPSILMLFSANSWASGRQVQASAKPTEKTKPPSLVKVASEEFVTHAKTIAVTDCATETNLCNSNYCARAYYSKTVQEEILTIVRDLITQEILFKGESERLIPVVEEFKSERSYYYQHEASGDYEKLMARCNSSRKTVELEIERNNTGKGKGAM